jgi:hypothetical protein
MAYQPSGPISSLGAFGPWADMGPLGLICHAIWILTCIILAAPVNETWSDFSDPVTVVLIKLLYTPILNEIMLKSMFSKYRWSKTQINSEIIFWAYRFHCDVVDVFNKKRSVYASWQHQFQRALIRSVISFREYWYGIRIRSDSRNLLYQNTEHWWLYNKTNYHTTVLFPRS